MAPGLVAYRFEANLFYANAHRFTNEVLRLVSQRPGPVKGLIIDVLGIDDVDDSAAKALLQLCRQLHARSIRTALVTTSNTLHNQLQRYGFSINNGAGNLLRQNT